MTAPCVLVVDGDLLVRNPLSEYLRECGYQVLEAMDAAEARRLLGEGSIQIDIVLADVGSPTEGGFALVAWVRRHHPAVRIVLAGTAAKAAEKAGDICQDGPAVAKPYDHRLLHDRILRLLAARDQNVSADSKTVG